ncbi:MAG: gliding motility-associated protein GldE [Cytophagales bacterium]|nr:gliding motility-associated protein GldE [Cytophagales bacterium]
MGDADNLDISPFFQALSPVSIVLPLGLMTLLSLSALISAAETALFSLGATERRACHMNKKRGDKYIISMLKQPQRLLATLLVVNNIANVGFVTLGVVWAWHLMKSQELEAWIFTLLTLILSFLIVFFGEVVPKTYASQHPLSYARWVAPLLSWIDKSLIPLTKPFVFLNKIMNVKGEKRANQDTLPYLDRLLSLTLGEDKKVEEQKNMLKSIFCLSERSVKEIMVSRMDIAGVEKTTKFQELMKFIGERKFSRIPIYQNTLDKIVGVLYTKDLLPYLNQHDTFKWQDIIKPAFFISEHKKIDSLFKDFQSKRVHMGIILDEYGGTTGIVTLEDIMEEIVGDIKDEYEELKDFSYKKIGPSTYLFEGKTSLNDLSKILEIKNSYFDEKKGESKSLGGLILELKSDLPSVGEKIYFKDIIFTVVKLSEKRIQKVEVSLKKAKKIDKKS